MCSEERASGRVVELAPIVCLKALNIAAELSANECME
jgi:hypothetical protein